MLVAAAAAAAAAQVQGGEAVGDNWVPAAKADYPVGSSGNIVQLPDADFYALLRRKLSDLAKFCASVDTSSPSAADINLALEALQRQVAQIQNTPQLPRDATLEELFGDHARQVIDQLAQAIPSLRNRKANAPLSTPPEYFGNAWNLRVEDRASMKSEWKRAIYKGKKGGPSVDVCETILRAAGVEVLPLQEVRARLLEVEASDSDSE